MNREIKFRAWDKRIKEMCEVTELLTHCHFVRYVTSNSEYEKGNYPEDIEIMQYTGLCDRNGKEIYEGDICTLFGAINHTIKFYNGAFGYCLEYAGFISFTGNTNFHLMNGQSQYIEVIGNVYENSELLKEEKSC